MTSDANLDINFAVPFRHRLRFTADVFEKDSDVLAELLDPGEQERARVQFWVDQNVADAQPDLKARIRRFCDEHPERIQRVGNVQMVPGGEPIKNDIHILEQMLKIFNVSDLDRRSYVVVIGGGAVLDTVGFAAAIAHRGIRLVRLPTTTLSQDDSGVGVKNGVNLFRKKNWLGSFAVPWAVVNDERLLETLSDRDFVAGFSEAVKVALLKDGDFYQRIVSSASQIRGRQMDAAMPVIRDSAIWHLRHITEGGDPFEMLEARPLDFGHWSAHKLEAMTEFEIRHGEAVAIGVAIDVLYSAKALGLAREDALGIVNCLRELGFDLYHEALRDTQTLLQGLEEFRQHLGGRLTVTMLTGIGQPVDVHEIDHELMCLAIEELAELSGRPTGDQDAQDKEGTPPGRSSRSSTTS